MMNGPSNKRKRDQNGYHPQVKIVSRSKNELVLEVYGEAAHCLDDVGEESPAVVLDWKRKKVCAAVSLANEVHPRLPVWMLDNYHYPITV